MSRPSLSSFFFFFNDTATTEIYTLSLHDALPISRYFRMKSRKTLTLGVNRELSEYRAQGTTGFGCHPGKMRSEEHTSELQSRLHLVCRLLLEKKKKRHSQGHRHQRRCRREHPSHT